MRYKLLALPAMFITSAALGCAGMGMGNGEPTPGTEETHPVQEQEPSAQVQQQAGLFLAKMRVINNGEIRAGQLAQSKGMSSSVIEFGRMLEQDHDQANQWVDQFASETGLQPGPHMDQARRELVGMLNDIQRLERLEGREFETEFLTMMLSGHRQAIDLVREAGDTIKQPEIQRLVVRVLPVLQHHQERARTLQQRQPEVTRTDW